ncbi:MAG: hypothetical protein ACJASX_003466, partial [Limisphaerales bacterium]
MKLQEIRAGKTTPSRILPPTNKFTMIHRFLHFLSLCLLAFTASAEVPGIHLADKTLKVELLDTHPEEFFLSHDMDLKGRLYLGSREAVFVYERT